MDVSRGVLSAKKDAVTILLRSFNYRGRFKDILKMDSSFARNVHFGSSG
jgi:hypothetical protein